MNDISDLNIRLLIPGEEKRVVDLLIKTFPKWAEFKDPINLYKWKYRESPNGSFIIVAELNGKIIGCNHTIILNAKLGSEIKTIRWDDDTAVNLDYRGQGIWSKIYAYKVELGLMNYFGYYTTTNPVIINQGEKNNWSTLLYNVTRMVKTNDIEEFFNKKPIKNKFIKKIGYLGLEAFTGFNNLFVHSYKPLSDFRIYHVNKFESDFDSFWDSVKDDYVFILEKKKKYMNWRFKDNERGKKIILQAIEGEKILGYIVLAYTVGAFEGQIVDLLALRDRFDVVDALVKNACEVFDDLNINTIYYQVVEGHPYQNITNRNGFIDSRSRPNIQFTSEAGSPEMEFLKNVKPSQIYFNYSTTF